MYSIYGVCQDEYDLDTYMVITSTSAPQPKFRIAFFMWCLKDEKGETVVVDTGYGEAGSVRLHIKGPDYLKSKMGEISVDPAKVEKVIVTHMHNDHWSAWRMFSNATFFVQKRELDFWAGPIKDFEPVARNGPKLEDIQSLLQAKRIKVIDGDKQILPGIEVKRVGGHTPGEQVVIVATKKGTCVLCGDAVDSYMNLEENSIGVRWTADLVESYMALKTVKSLTCKPELIVPGHDPLILKRFPSGKENIAQIA